MKPILYYLVGLPASGKSTWAKNKENNNTILISSDNMRKELYCDINNQEHNGELFQKINKRVKDLLKQGKNVIYDATNINSKRRISFLKELKKIDCYKQCIYFGENIMTCISNDMNRNRNVGYDVIKRMYKNLQIPMYFEGWDDIEIIRNKVKSIETSLEYKCNSYNDYMTILTNTCMLDIIDCIGLGQDNPYHTLSVSGHMYYTYKWLKQYNIQNKYLLIASLFHDIGKAYCKEFKDRYAHYYGHENVSAQLLTMLLYDKSNFSKEEIIKIVTYVQLHMRLLNLNDSDKGKEKFRNLVGEELFNDLILLYNADTQAK